MERKRPKKTKLLATAFSIFAAQIAALNISFAQIDYENPVLNQAESGEQTQEIEEYKIFVSTGCPHCAVVEDFVESSNLNELANINFYDTAVDPSYTDTMMQLIQERGQEYQGVPTLIAGQDVIVGDTPIIDYFKSNFPDLQESIVEQPSEPEKEPIDWGKWAVIGLVGISGIVVVAMIVMSFV